MSKVASRLAKLEAVVPKPPPQIEYDFSRLTPDQMARAGQLRRRVDEVGLEGLTDEELDEAAAIRELIVPITAPTEVRR